jgi:hypothetical protein
LNGYLSERIYFNERPKPDGDYYLDELGVSFNKKE